MNADEVSPDAARKFLAGAIAVFQYHKDLAERAAAQLDDERLRRPLDANTNSVAVVMKHVAGNLRSRFTGFLTTDGEKPWRDRDREFIDDYGGRDDVLADWQRGWDCLFAALDALSPADLSRTVTIRGEPHSVPLAIERSLGHCAYHVGQIVLTARLLAGDDWQTLTIPRGESQRYNSRVWNRAT